MGHSGLPSHHHHKLAVPGTLHGHWVRRKWVKGFVSAVYLSLCEALTHTLTCFPIVALPAVEAAVYPLALLGRDVLRPAPDPVAVLHLAFVKGSCRWRHRRPLRLRGKSRLVLLRRERPRTLGSNAANQNHTKQTPEELHFGMGRFTTGQNYKYSPWASGVGFYT